jgi:5-bromo-4-chloroindolyl phosphate hydrolysis protein
MVVCDENFHRFYEIIKIMSDSQVENFVKLSSKMTFLESVSVKNAQTYKSFGSRISALLAKNEIVNKPETVGVLDDL